MTHFQKAQFVKSCLKQEDFPKSHLPEVAFIARSNAGKSSLINHLTQHNQLAYVSATPGKTQLINFFLIDEKLFLVDLPGYGFAKTSLTTRTTWGQALTDYLENRKQLRLLVLLLDIRRELSPEDVQMISWANNQNRKILFVLSKTDKIASSHKKAAEETLLKEIRSLMPSTFSYVPYSIKEGSCRAILRNTILTLLQSSEKEHHGPIEK